MPQIDTGTRAPKQETEDVMTYRGLAKLLMSVVAAVGAACSQQPSRSAPPSPVPAPAATMSQTAMPVMPTFSADEVTSALGNIAFKTRSSVPAIGGDVMDYFDVDSDPVLRTDRAVILGKMRVKLDHVRLRGTTTDLPPGDYIDWMGKKNGTWVRGYSVLGGKVVVETEAHFGEPPAEHHQSTIHVFFTDASQFDAKVAETRASGIGPVTGTPPQRTPPQTTPPGRTPPQRQEPPPQRPPPQRQEPPPQKPPPLVAHCVMKCKTLLDLDKKPPQQYWMVDWVEVH